MADIHKGRCQCGAVEYEFTGSPQTIHACHCSECQKRSGSAFGLTMVVNRKNFTITGQVSTYVRAADSGQTNTSYFCPNCGNPIYGRLCQTGVYRRPVSCMPLANRIVSVPVLSLNAVQGTN